MYLFCDKWRNGFAIDEEDLRHSDKEGVANLFLPFRLFFFYWLK